MYAFLLLDNGGFPRSKKEIAAWLDASGQKDHSSIPGAGGMFKALGPGIIGLNLPEVRKKLFGNARVSQLVKIMATEGSVAAKGADATLLREWVHGKNLWHGSQLHAGSRAQIVQENPPGTFELTDEWEDRMAQIYGAQEPKVRVLTDLTGPKPKPKKKRREPRGKFLIPAL